MQWFLSQDELHTDFAWIEYSLLISHSLGNEGFAWRDALDSYHWQKQFLGVDSKFSDGRWLLG